ncbi:unnamed protein product [Rotaria magnacalcarata]|uniref:CAP-Gly domain-containing protein n=2 Tax=Rotaria magnacalcarata TaxID=392030 RepID=A0A814X7E9_9BILA|nr:unnamed protein product [Rotaria magnacalcarata]
MEKHPATVCYFGLVDNHSGEWIGIEWWNQQGKHNGTAERQRHNRSDSELKQQHEILLSTLLLEQQLHSTATDEHKRRVNEVTLKIKY